MKLHLLIFLALTATSIAAPKYAKPGCNDTCGNNVMIPYPFGIGANCSVNEWYTVECNSSTPYLSALNHLEITSVNLEDQTLIVNTPTVSYCQNPVWNSSEKMSVDLGGSPFLFSRSKNKFVFEGCGVAVLMDNGIVLAECSTPCLNQTVRERNMGYNFGSNRCQMEIPHFLKSYSINQRGLGGNEGCGFGIVVDDDSYVKGSFSVTSVPISLTWTHTSSNLQRCCQGASLSNQPLKTGNGTSVYTLGCYMYSSYTGNPYYVDGCEVREECTRCPGPQSCPFDMAFNDDGSTRQINFRCVRTNYPFGSKSSMGVILGA